MRSTNRPNVECYFSLHRPTSWIGTSYGVKKPGVWLVESYSLTSFKRYSLLLRAEQDTKLRPAPPPIKTKRGWLVIYHGVSKSKVYRIGAAVLVLNEPNMIRGQCKIPF